MASYAKQMRDLAVMWIAANPDEEDPFLRIPNMGTDLGPDLAPGVASLTMLKQRADELAVKFADDPRYAKHAADTQDLIDRTKAQISQREELQTQIDETYRELTKLVNSTPEEGRAGYTPGNPLRGHVEDLGRWLLTWARQGYNAFELSADFTAAMLLTDPSEIELSSVRLPFRGMLWTIPSGFAQGAEGGHYTKIHIWELPARDVKMLDVANRVAGALDELPPEKAREVLHDRMSMEKTLSADGIGPDSTDADNAAPWICVQATDGARAFLWMTKTEGLTWASIEELPVTDGEGHDDTVRFTIQQIIFGTLAYLNAVKDGAQPRQAHKKAKAKKAERAPADEIKHWEIGRDVRIDPRLVQAARSGVREIAFKIKSRFIVRGHYRNQACGEGRQERRRIWIQPFYKGPEEGAKIVHTYKPQLDEESP